MRPLAYIALAGIGTAVVSLSLAAAVRDPDNSPTWSGDASHFWGCGRMAKDSSAGDGKDVVSRQYEWEGGDTLELNLPATVRFRPGPTWKLTASGAPRVLDQLTVDSGRIGLKRGNCVNSAYPSLELSGPALADVTINGSGDVLLDQLKQENLAVDIHGSGSVKATGSVDTLTVRIAGSGDAMLQELAAQSADVSIAGSGDVEIKPVESAEILINGSGDVRLHSRPKHLTSRVNGSGAIVDSH